jgi:hypothetical protein
VGSIPTSSIILSLTWDLPTCGVGVSVRVVLHLKRTLVRIVAHRVKRAADHFNMAVVRENLRAAPLMVTFKIVLRTASPARATALSNTTAAIGQARQQRTADWIVTSSYGLPHHRSCPWPFLLGDLRHGRSFAAFSLQLEMVGSLRPIGPAWIDRGNLGGNTLGISTERQNANPRFSAATRNIYFGRRSMDRLRAPSSSPVLWRACEHQRSSGRRVDTPDSRCSPCRTTQRGPGAKRAGVNQPFTN